MQAISIKYYYLPLECKKQIAQEKGCALMTVHRALLLTNPVQSELANAIRERAVAMGAKINVRHKYINA